MNSKEYWKKRFLADKAGTINRSERFIREKTNKYYKQALKEIQEEIEQFYKKFADKNKISLTEAKKIIQASDFKKVDFESMVKTQIHRNQELKQQMNKLPVDVAALIEKQHTRYEKMLAGFTKKGQITRLELLQVNIEKILLDLYDVQQVNIYEHLAKEYEDSYYKGIFNTQQAMGFGKDFTAINKKAVDQAILNTYNRRNYSKTIWGHRQALTEDLRSNIVTGLIQGASMERMASRISKRLDVSRSNAYRLIRTETAYIHEQATKKAYEEAGIQKYEYLATLDRKTSSLCQGLDGEKFNIADAQPGKNYPPMHPNCRSTTVCTFEDDVVTSRLARDSSGKTYEVPSNMSYKEWYSSLSETEKGKMSMLNKMDKNRGADKKQLNRYKDVLGKEAPSLFNFQKIKYNNTREYALLQQYKKAVNKGDINVLTGFEEYKKVDKDITDRIHGITLTNGIQVSGHSLHFIDRVIGAHSYQDQGKAGLRQGVKIEDIKETLINSFDFSDVRTTIDSKGKHKKSQNIYGENVTISFNPDTGNLIQVQPRRKKG